MGYIPAWAYTVGLTPVGRPELLVTGMSLSRATRLLNDVASHVLHAASPPPGEQIPLVGGPLIEIVEVQEPTAHLVTAVEIYGPRYGHCSWCTLTTFAGGRGRRNTVVREAVSRYSGRVLLAPSARHSPWRAFIGMPLPTGTYFPW